MKDKTLLSVIVPAYNEAGTIEFILRKIHAVDFPKEIIIVDDGSADQTSDTVRALMPEMPEVSLLRLGRNRGKGYAIRLFFRRSNGQRLLTGISPDLVRSSAAFTETARRILGMFIAARRSIPGTMPAVEIVIWRKAMSKPF